MNGFYEPEAIAAIGRLLQTLICSFSIFPEKK
jgi:hypothetical protein